MGLLCYYFPVCPNYRRLLTGGLQPILTPGPDSVWLFIQYDCNKISCDKINLESFSRQ